MKRTHSCFIFVLAALSACTQMQSAQQPTPAPTATEPVTPAVPPPQPVESKPELNTKEFEEESQRLLSMQKSYFSVFRIDEASIGLKPRQNAVGVFDLQKPPRGERMRLTVSQQAKKPARLAVGTYTVVLDTVVDYIEIQTCQSAACAGKRQRIVRSLPKQLQIQISPQNQYFGSKDFSLAELANAEGKDKNYKSMYQNVVVTVKRISVVPVPPAPA
ncbi:hypothetical protein SAMN05518865_10891 [Duganella sp. CF458]|uniref:hypothetical protein n=1 Tax=Duganella sp. CF458 TaxID=1884368 RepID=UPI0008E60841|nr:hypothetical protein [Duganella sp. CF458]SFG09209.1 hypothetical protein SAMN05518865_10891 [Duganella sp. CF458]